MPPETAASVFSSFLGASGGCLLPRLMGQMRDTSELSPPWPDRVLGKAAFLLLPHLKTRRGLEAAMKEVRKRVLRTDSLSPGSFLRIAEF